MSLALLQFDRWKVLRTRRIVRVFRVVLYKLEVSIVSRRISRKAFSGNPRVQVVLGPYLVSDKRCCICLCLEDGFFMLFTTVRK